MPLATADTLVANIRANFPPELLAQRIWCLHDANKQPYAIASIAGDEVCVIAGSSTNRTLWHTFDEVASAVVKGDGYGVGCYAPGDYTFTDIDKCVVNGVIEPWAERLVDDLCTYTEFSPSGTGVHMFNTGALGTLGSKKDGVEAYSTARYFTVTGNRVGTNDLAPLALDRLVKLHDDIAKERIRPKGAGVAAKSSSLIVTRPLTFEELEAGESPEDGSTDGVDHSVGDFQWLCILLEREPGILDDEIEERWRTSGRTRAKLDYHKTYVADTIKSARKAQAENATKGDKVEPMIDPDNWLPLFDTPESYASAKQLEFLVSSFVQEKGITFIGGLPGHGKTLMMLSLCKALLTGNPLFGHKGFEVVKRAKRVIYLVPECHIVPFKHRIDAFKLMPFINDRSLLTQTMRDETVELNDPRLLRAAEGADVFLDTAIRFKDGDENSAEDNKEFAKLLFKLQGAGARSIIGAHHSPKAFAEKDYETLENAIRGSGDIGAMLSAAWAVRMDDAKTTTLYVSNIKARDFEPCEPFKITGRPTIDETGDFTLTGQPGLVQRAKKKGGRAPSLTQDDLIEVTADWKASGTMSNRAFARKIGVSREVLAAAGVFEVPRDSTLP